MTGGKSFIKKKDAKPVQLYTLDTETRGLDGDIFRIGIYDGKSYTPGKDFKSIKQILLNQSITHDVHIFIHNLNFDLSKIIKDLQAEILFLESVIINGRATIIKTKDFTFHDSYSLFPSSLDKLCKDFDIKDRKMDLVKALDGSKYIQYVKQIKQTLYSTKTDKKLILVRKPKNKIDKKATLKKYFMEVDPMEPLLNEYLEFDCKSLFEIVETTIKISGLDAEDFVTCPTTASLSLKAYKTKFKDDYKKAISSIYEGRNHRVEEKLRSAYYGGRTEVFIPKLKGGYHYDVNSLYPFCMREYLFPCGEYQEMDGMKARLQWKLFEKTNRGGGIVEATVTIPNDLDYPILPYRALEKGKLLFPTGTISGSWTMHELLFAVQRGVQIQEIRSMIYYPYMTDLFKSFVTYFEKLKNDNTYDAKDPDKKVNPALRQFAKLILNSLYGKFATGREKTSYTSIREILETIEKLSKKEQIFTPEIKFFENVKKYGVEEAQKIWFREEDREILGRMPTQYKNRRIGEDLIQYTSFITSEYVQVQISAYVTAYARMELYKGIENILEKGAAVYYCDTDSIVADEVLDDEFISDTEFGKWKLEGEIKLAYFNQPKVYIEETADGYINKKFKGMPHARVDLLNMSDYAYINKRQEKQDVDSIPLIKKEDGYVNQIKPITAIKKNEEFGRLIQIEKGLNIRGLMEKRKMDYANNTSSPWSFDEGAATEMKEYFHKLREENMKFLEETRDPIYRYVKENGYIQIPKKGTSLYRRYLEISPKVRRKYFRTKGIPLDVVGDAVEYHPEDLLEELSCEM